MRRVPSKFAANKPRLPGELHPMACRFRIRPLPAIMITTRGREPGLALRSHGEHWMLLPSGRTGSAAFREPDGMAGS